MSNLVPDSPPNHPALLRQYVDGVQALHDGAMLQIGGGRFIGPQIRRKLNSVVGVPVKFIIGIAATLVENPRLASVSPGGAARLLEGVELTESLEVTAQRHDLLARECRETAAVRRAEISEESLRVYQICKSFNRKADLQEIVPTVKDLKEALGRGKTRKVTTPDDGTSPAAALKGAK